jgi:hypothetical protein
VVPPVVDPIPLLDREQRVRIVREVNLRPFGAGAELKADWRVADLGIWRRNVCQVPVMARLG